MIWRVLKICCRGWKSRTKRAIHEVWEESISIDVLRFLGL